MLVKRLDALGCHVMAGCLTEAGETELSKSCSDRMHAVSLDVSKPDSVRRALDKVKALLPPGKGWDYLSFWILKMAKEYVPNFCNMLVLKRSGHNII